MLSFFIISLVIIAIVILTLRMFFRGVGKVGMFAAAQLNDPIICPACGRSVKVIGVSSTCPECQTRIIRNVDGVYVIPGQKENNYSLIPREKSYVFELLGTDYETEKERVAQRALASLSTDDEVHLRLQDGIIIVMAGMDRIGHLTIEDADKVIEYIPDVLKAKVKHIYGLDPRNCSIEVYIPTKDINSSAS